jgi:hypothetical protein
MNRQVESAFAHVSLVAEAFVSGVGPRNVGWQASYSKHGNAISHAWRHRTLTYIWIKSDSLRFPAKSRRGVLNTAGVLINPYFVVVGHDSIIAVVSINRYEFITSVCCTVCGIAYMNCPRWGLNHTHMTQIVHMSTFAVEVDQLISLSLLLLTFHKVARPISVQP